MRKYCSDSDVQDVEDSMTESRYETAKVACMSFKRSQVNWVVVRNVKNPRQEGGVER